MNDALPWVYIIVGAATSGRREVLADLIEGGLQENDCPVVMLAADERPDVTDGKWPAMLRWSWHEKEIVASVPPGTTHVFFVTDGRGNPIDQLEAIQAWIPTAGVQLARVLCVVHCRLAEQQPSLLAWYDACIHFSDVVLLNRRDGVANKWMSDFRARYKGQFFPCLFEMVKEGRVKNPPLVLEPQALRLSQVFEESEWAGLEDIEVEVGIDDDETPTDAGDEGDDDTAILPPADPYFERDLAGRRVKEIPDIGRLLARVAE